MPEPTYIKTCPKCGRTDNLGASACTNCSHVYRTRFDAAPFDAAPFEKSPPAPTQMYQPPRVPPPTPPAQYHQPPQQGYYQPPPRPVDAIQVRPGSHSVATAVILSLVIIGAGQMFNKQVLKGITFLLGAILLAVPTYGGSFLVASIIGLVDAIQIANRLNRGEVVTQWQFF